MEGDKFLIVMDLNEGIEVTTDDSFGISVF